jgi:hypothetical protein
MVQIVPSWVQAASPALWLFFIWKWKFSIEKNRTCLFARMEEIGQRRERLTFLEGPEFRPGCELGGESEVK